MTRPWPTATCWSKTSFPLRQWHRLPRPAASPAYRFRTRSLRPTRRRRRRPPCRAQRPQQRHLPRRPLQPTNASLRASRSPKTSWQSQSPKTSWQSRARLHHRPQRHPPLHRPIRRRPLRRPMVPLLQRHRSRPQLAQPAPAARLAPLPVSRSRQPSALRFKPLARHQQLPLSPSRLTSRPALPRAAPL